MSHLTIDVTLKLPPPSLAITPFLVVISVVFYALTGAISATVVCILYNLTSRFWPGISGQVDVNGPVQPDIGF